MPQWGTTDETDEPVPSGKIFAPFTQEQITRLNHWQQAGGMHPFTCPDHSTTSLVAYEYGWICPHAEGFQPIDVRCGYTQNWAHAFMAAG